MSIGLFGGKVPGPGTADEVEVSIAGRPFRVRRALLDDIAQQNLAARIHDLRKALLIFHSPTDDTVGIDNASHIFLAAKHPKSFISLAGADHLISRHGDAVYIADVIAAWAEHYLDMAADAVPMADDPTEPSSFAKRETAPSSRKSVPVSTACLPTSRSRPAGWTRASVHTICCWRRSAPARR